VARAVSDGRVLPFSWINCATLTQFLTPVLMDQTGVRRECLYGRRWAASSRTSCIISSPMSPDTTKAALAKPSFTARDVLADQFGFNHTTLVKLQAIPALDARFDDSVPFEESAGR